MFECSFENRTAGFYFHLSLLIRLHIYLLLLTSVESNVVQRQHRDFATTDMSTLNSLGHMFLVNGSKKLQGIIIQAELAFQTGMWFKIIMIHYCYC